MYSYAGSINQNLAACGWNVVGVANNVNLSYDVHRTEYAVVCPSKSGSSYYCGADAIQVKLGH